MTVPFEFRSDRHCGIKRDPGSLDQRAGEQGSSDEIAGNQVARELISQGWSRNPNHGFTEGLCVSVERIAG
jgi:hypothetical protein